MRAVVSLNRGYMDRTDTSIARTSGTVATTLYDLLMALQRIYGPHNDDFVLSLVTYWLLSGHLRTPVEVLQKHRCPFGSVVYE